MTKSCRACNKNYIKFWTVSHINRKSKTVHSYWCLLQFSNCTIPCFFSILPYSVFCLPLFIYLFWWCAHGSLPSVRNTFSDINVKLNLELMLTGLTSISFVSSNKIIMRFRHSYSEERSRLFMDHFILQIQRGNSELQIKISPTWLTGNFISLLIQGGILNAILVSRFLKFI